MTYLIWLRHVLDAEADSRGVPRAHVRYDDLLADAPAALDRICRELGLALPGRDGSSTAADIETFLSPDLRHHSSGDDALLADADISDWIRGSFRILERWTRGEADKADGGELDRIRTALDAAAPAFGRALAAGQEAGRECRVLARELISVSDTLETTREAFRERDRRLDEQNERLAEQWKKLEAARHALTERNQRLTVTWQQLEAARRTLGERERELAAAVKALETARVTVASQDIRLTELATDLDGARRGHLLALARRGRRGAFDHLEVVARPTPRWLAEARGRGPGPAPRAAPQRAGAGAGGRSRGRRRYRAHPGRAVPARHRRGGLQHPRRRDRRRPRRAHRPRPLARARRGGRGREPAATRDPRLAARCGPPAAPAAPWPSR